MVCNPNDGIKIDKSIARIEITTNNSIKMLYVLSCQHTLPNTYSTKISIDPLNV